MNRRLVVKHFDFMMGAEFLFVLVVLFPVVVWAQPTRPEILAAYVDTRISPLAIDGQMNDWPARALANAVNFYKGDGHGASAQQYGTTVLGTMSNRQDGETTLCLAHDGESLYLLAIIQDDLLEQRTAETNANEAWKEDCLHLYVDSTAAGAANIANPPIVNQVGYEQFGVSTDYNCYTENCDFTTRNGNGGALAGAQPDQQHWRVSIRITGSGPYTYYFEEKIPLREVAGHNLRTMEPGKKYGFDAEFCDSDAGVYLQGWIFWSGDGSLDAWNYENLWGWMTLEPVPNRARNSAWALY